MLFYKNCCRVLGNAFCFYNGFCRVMTSVQLYRLLIYKFLWQNGIIRPFIPTFSVYITFQCCRKQLPPDRFYKISCRTTCFPAFVYNDLCRNGPPGCPVYNLLRCRGAGNGHLCLNSVLTGILLHDTIRLPVHRMPSSASVRF